MQPDLPAHSLPSPFTSSATPELQAEGPSIFSASGEAAPARRRTRPPVGPAETVLPRDALLQGNLKERHELTAFSLRLHKL